MCRIFFPAVISVDLVQVRLDVRACRRIDVHDRVDVVIHGFLDQRCMEVTRVEGDEPDGGLALRLRPSMILPPPRRASG